MMGRVTFFFFLISCKFQTMSIKLNRNGDLINSVFMRINETSVKDSTKVSEAKEYSCDGLNGDKAMQCLTLKVSSEIVSTSSLAAKKIIEEARDVSSKIKSVSVNNAKIVKKYNFSFAVSFLQVYDELVLLVKNCSKFEAVKRLNCLINLGATGIKSTGDIAASNILKTADNTGKKVATLNKVINTISGFEGMSKQIKKATGDMTEKAKSVSKKLKDIGKNTANAVKQAAGIKTAFLEVKENAMQCQGLNGVALMNCISKNAAKKMENIGVSVARDFSNEANNIANKINTLGNDVAKHIKKEFSKLNKKGLLKKEVASSNAAFITSLIGCNKLVGIPKIKCIIVRGASQIHKSGQISSKAIDKVGKESTAIIYNAAKKMKKISGFETYASNAHIAAGAMQTKSKKLADMILKSCRTA